MSQEVWKKVTGYDNLLASNYGRFKRINSFYFRNGIKVRAPEKILTPYYPNNGEVAYIERKIDGKKNFINVPLTIASLFVEKPSNSICVRHKDGDKRNNRADNLEWIERSLFFDNDWKDIPGYEGKYKVSRYGEVVSLNFSNKRESRILSKIISSSGYYVVTLSGRQRFIHRLVAEAFCEHREGYDVVDHINTITTDNRAENLRWTDAFGNVNNPISKKRRIDSIREKFKGKHGKDTPKHRGCIQLDLDGNVIKIWDCMSDAWRALHIDSGSLTRACQGKQASAGGFIWEYTDQ